MGWGVGTSFCGIAGGPLHSNDFIFYYKTWEEKWASANGTPLVILDQPAPAARGLLDDDIFNTGLVQGPAAPYADGGRRAKEEFLRRKWKAQLLIDYKIGSLDPGAFSAADRFLVKDSQELLPVLMRTWARQVGYKLATTQEGLNWLAQRPDWVPSGIYYDTKCRVLEEIQRHLLEPIIDKGVTWQLWGADEVHKVLEYRTHRFLVETGILRKEVFTPTTIGSTTIAVPQDSIEVRRVDFEYSDLRQKPRALQRIDTLQADNGIVGWDDGTAEPVSYIEDPMVDSMTIRTCPPPDAVGTVGIRYVPMPPFDQGIPCEPLPIPRLFTWAVKWGVIADLLKKEGSANDPVRSAEAEQIYDLGVSLAKFLLGAKA